MPHCFQAVFDEFPSVPAAPAFDYDYSKDDPVKKPFGRKEDHPFYHEKTGIHFHDDVAVSTRIGSRLCDGMCSKEVILLRTLLP